MGQTQSGCGSSGGNCQAQTQQLERNALLGGQNHSTDQPGQKPHNRRNMRTAIEQRRQAEGEQQRQQQRRQNRSRSLEPKAAHEIRAIEHSKSARYGPRSSTGANKKGREKELWNPEKAAAQLIGLQLQNPHAAQQNLLVLIGGQQQQLLPRPYRKQSGAQQLSIDFDFEERRDLNVTGLTSHQISIIQKIWERSPESEIADCAKNIMAHLLRSNAQMYQFFDLIGISDRDIQTSATFLRQSANFAIVLDFVLTNVQDEPQKVCMALQCLGAQHARLPWPIELHHWSLFTRCFEDNPPKEVFQNAEGHDLWKSMINFIIVQMRLGYERATGVESSPTTPGSVLSSPRLGAHYNRKPSREGAGGRANSRLRGGFGTRANTMAAENE